MPVFGIIAIVVIAIVIVAMIVFFVMRSTRKAKAVGGVKGKTVKKTKAPEKKGGTKAVKVLSFCRVSLSMRLPVMIILELSFPSSGVYELINERVRTCVAVACEENSANWNRKNH